MLNAVKKIFSIDSRSLGLARIFLGFILTIDTFSKLIYAKDFYTDEGIMPRIPYVRDYMGSWAFSLHLASGELWFQVLLLSLGIIFSFLFMIGFKWRQSAIIAFVLLCSMQNRNMIILSGADDVLRLFLFWFLFMPSPGSFAVDRIESKPKMISGVATTALMLQLLLIYIFTAIWKLNPVYTEEYSAVYYSLHLDYFAKPLGVYLRDWNAITQLLTMATMGLEAVGPILVLLPFWPVRFFTALGFQIFHLGLFATLALGTFSWIMMVYWIIFWPAQVWDLKVFSLCEQALNRFFNYISQKWFVSPPPLTTTSIISANIRYRFSELLSLGFLILVVAYNASGVSSNPNMKLAEPFEHVAQATNINQKWWMFAPRPAREDGWFVIEGTYDNGKTIDLLTGKTAVYEKPVYLADFYAAEEWTTYMLRLWQDSNNILIEPYAKYLCRRFRNDPNMNNASVQYIEIYFFEEYTPPMGEAFGPTEEHHLWSHVCFD